MAGSIRPQNGLIKLVEGQSRCGVRLRSLGRSEMRRRGELQPAQGPAMSSARFGSA